MVTCRLRFCASASAAATIVLTAARSRYFLEGSWAKQFAARSNTTVRVRFNIRACLLFGSRNLTHLQNLNTVATQLNASGTGLSGQKIGAGFCEFYSLGFPVAVQEKHPALAAGSSHRHLNAPRKFHGRLHTCRARQGSKHPGKARRIKVRSYINRLAF